MNRNMFGDVTDPGITVGGKRGYTVPLSIAAHAVILAAMIIIPLLAIDTLPVPRTLVSFMAAIPIAMPPPIAPGRATTAATPVTAVNADTAPLEAPHDVAPEPALATGASV